jgi:SAM-dependent methyltransferase
MRVLDVGCGSSKRANAVGIDKSPYPNVDIVCDLERFPWPIGNSSFDVIVCKHVLEHLRDVVGVMEEIHRIARPGAKVIIEVPHFSHPDAFRDPTHIHFFSYFSFDYFTGSPLYPEYTKARFKIVKKSFRATSGLNRFMASRVKPHLYEERFARIFPSYGLSIEMEPVK